MTDDDELIERREAARRRLGVTDRAQAGLVAAVARDAGAETEAERSKRRRELARLERESQRRRLRHKHPILRQCEWFECKTFLPDNAREDAKYCSTVCRVREHRWRKQNPN